MTKEERESDVINGENHKLEMNLAVAAADEMDEVVREAEVENDDDDDNDLLEGVDSSGGPAVQSLDDEDDYDDGDDDCDEYDEDDDCDEDNDDYEDDDEESVEEEWADVMFEELQEAFAVMDFIEPDRAWSCIATMQDLHSQYIRGGHNSHPCVRRFPPESRHRRSPPPP